MKKHLPAILIILCIAVIAIGVICLAATKNSKPSVTPTPISSQSVHNNESNSEAHNNSHIANLDDVKMNPNLPSQLKEYTGFRVSFNANNKTPNWVAWELLGSETSGQSQRSNKFWTDSDIDQCPSTSDYARSGYDRGHMCPAADQKWSEQAMHDCFVMANMCPQDHSLNSGAWNTLENKERSWALRDSAIMIVAGPIYSDSDRHTIGSNKVRVPSAFFKCIISPYSADPKGIAFIFPNMSAPGNMENYVATIDQVEQLTGFDFFHALPDEIENKIEATSSFREWNRRK